MEPFLMYIIVCVASAGGCAEHAPSKSWVFKNQKDCTIFVGKIYMAFIKKYEEEGLIVVDGRAFCLRFKETKKA